MGLITWVCARGLSFGSSIEVLWRNRQWRQRRHCLFILLDVLDLLLLLAEPVEHVLGEATLFPAMALGHARVSGSERTKIDRLPTNSFEALAVAIPDNQHPPG